MAVRIALRIALQFAVQWEHRLVCTYCSETAPGRSTPDYGAEVENVRRLGLGKAGMTIAD